MEHPFNDDLKDVLDSDEAYEFLPTGTWMAGGCALLAESLQRLIPNSQLKFVGRLDLDCPDHVVLVVEDYTYGEQVFIDYDGLQSEAELVAKMKMECLSSNVGITDYTPEKLAGSAIDWLHDDVPRFSRFLESELGEIDAERVSLLWNEEDFECELAGPSIG